VLPAQSARKLAYDIYDTVVLGACPRIRKFVDGGIET
jgi:hypothetical protein